MTVGDYGAYALPLSGAENMADALLPRTKAALNITTANDDVELLDLLTAAGAEYEQHVALLPGTHTLTISGGGSMHLLPLNVGSITAAVYTDGTAIDLAGLDLDASTGILHTPLTYGSRNVTLTVTVGDLPANHAQTIVADVAEYWTRTQRSGGGARPSFGGDGFDVEAGRPIVMFPRIRALAVSSVA